MRLEQRLVGKYYQEVILLVLEQQDEQVRQGHWLNLLHLHLPLHALSVVPPRVYRWALPQKALAHSLPLC